MGKKSRRDAKHRSTRVNLPLGRFLYLLHQSIGGSGPKIGPGKSECAAFRRDHPDHTLTVEEFKTEYLWGHIMRKFDDGKTSDNKKQKALKALLDAEESCKTSYRGYQALRRSCRPLFYDHDGRGVTMDAVMHMASRKIERLLGDFRWQAMISHVGFGPGATTLLPKRSADLWFKFREVPEASTPCVPLVRWYLMHYAPLWRQSLWENKGATYVKRDSNKVVTVPKNSETDRPIAIEPQWNMFFQKGIGGFIRHRLQKVGVNLDDQRRNQRMALAGSLDGRSATIDLSSASDTVSRWLVHELLPADWVAAMERCRSQYSVLPSGERILLRKFSSMGNGYTFELESLIFWAVSTTVTQFACKGDLLKDRRVGIYGDDIIVPVEAYGPLSEVLTALGFTLNAEKSFADGPFRESCGTHAYNGTDVTPFYIRRPVRSLKELFLLHNNLVRWAARNPYGVRDARVREVVNWLRSFAPAKWRKPRLCDGYGDGAFIGSFDECTPSHEAVHACQTTRAVPTWPRKAKGGLEGWRIRVRIPRLAPIEFEGKQLEDDARLLRSLWALRLTREAERLNADWIPFQEFTGMIPSKEAGVVVRTLHVVQWHEMGPWFDYHEGSYKICCDEVAAAA